MFGDQRLAYKHHLDPSPLIRMHFTHRLPYTRARLPQLQSTIHSISMATNISTQLGPVPSSRPRTIKSGAALAVTSFGPSSIDRPCDTVPTLLPLWQATHWATATIRSTPPTMASRRRPMASSTIYHDTITRRRATRRANGVRAALAMWTRSAYDEWCTTGRHRRAAFSIARTIGTWDSERRRTIHSRSSWASEHSNYVWWCHLNQTR